MSATEAEQARINELCAKYGEYAVKSSIEKRQEEFAQLGNKTPIFAWIVAIISFPILFLTFMSIFSAVVGGTKIIWWLALIVLFGSMSVFGWAQSVIKAQKEAVFAYGPNLDVIEHELRRAHEKEQREMEFAQRAEMETIRAEEAKKQVVDFLDEHIETIVSSVRALSDTGDNAPMVILIDGELKKILKNKKVLNQLLSDEEALSELETSYQIMQEKGLIDKFMEPRFQKIFQSKIS